MTSRDCESEFKKILAKIEDDRSLIFHISKFIDEKYKIENRIWNGAEQKYNGESKFPTILVDDYSDNLKYSYVPVNNRAWRSQSMGSMGENFSFNSYSMMDSNKMMDYHPLVGCLCDVCSTLKNMTNCSYIRKQRYIPANSSVVLEENKIGQYLYFGHQKTLKNEKIDYRFCSIQREVGHYVCVLDPYHTECLVQDNSIKAIYVPLEKENDVGNTSNQHFNSVKLENSESPSVFSDSRDSIFEYLNKNGSQALSPPPSEHYLDSFRRENCRVSHGNRRVSLGDSLYLYAPSEKGNISNQHLNSVRLETSESPSVFDSRDSICESLNRNGSQAFLPPPSERYLDSYRHENYRVSHGNRRVSLGDSLYGNGNSFYNIESDV